MNLVTVKDFDKNTLLSFFSPLEFTIAVHALIEGLSKGALWLDDLTNPSLGLLWDYSDGVYLVSKEYSESSRIKIKNIFNKVIIPEAEKRSKSPILVLYAFPREWNDHISKILSSLWSNSPETAFFFQRSLSHNENINSSVSLPAHYIGQTIDSNLFNSDKLQFLPDLHEEAESDWGSIENFLSRGYGYCVIDEKTDSLASWCVIGKIARNCAELGVETREKHRRKGLAIHVVNKVISFCVQNELTPHWYCFQNNNASIKLADKLGFQKIQDFLVNIIEKKV